MAQPQGNDDDPLARVRTPAWYAVLGATLAVGGWSMYHLMRLLGLPQEFAIVGAGIFDLASLIFSSYAKAAAERGYGIVLPGLFMLGTVGVSAYANHAHGVALGWGQTGGILLGSVPLLLEGLFLTYVADFKGQALADAGLLPERMPRVGTMNLIFHPWRSKKAINAVLLRRLEAIEHGDDAPTAVAAKPEPAPGILPAGGMFVLMPAGPAPVALPAAPVAAPEPVAVAPVAPAIPATNATRTPTVTARTTRRATPSKRNAASEERDRIIAAHVAKHGDTKAIAELALALGVDRSNASRALKTYRERESA